VGFSVQGPAILLGAPEDNPILKFALDNGFLPYRPDPRKFPGRGRGYLSWQRDAVGYGQESVALIAHDAAGMDEAVGSSYEMMAGLDPLMPLALAGESSVIPASKRLESCPEARVAWEAWLPDRAARIAPLPGGRTAILSRDGSLRVLGGDGSLIWQAAFEGGEAWACDASPSGDLVVVGASKRVLAWDGAGRRLWDAAVRDESPAATVTFVAASPDSGSVAFGGSDGSLSLVLRDGKRSWTLPGDAPGQDPQPWAAGIFDASGKVLVALSSKELRASSAADGSVLCRIPGWSARVEPRLFADGILVSSGEDKVGIFSPEKRMVLAEVKLPHGGVTAAVPFPDGLLVSTESDGAIRALKLQSETGAEKLLWEHKLERRIPRKVVPGARRIAVAWWGGTLEILGETGTSEHLQKFPQDISDLAWAGDRLVVGLADGRVLALEAR
jgi:hypothetical protein